MAVARCHALRRTMFAAMLTALLLLAIWPSPVAGQEATSSALSRFTGETFVGETSDPDVLVAIVLGEPGAGVRPARGYLCDGPGMRVDAWLTGEASGDRVELSAEDGTDVSGTLNAAGIGGGATLADGRTLVFTALPATGLGGLFTYTRSADGRLEGSSAAGGRLSGAMLGAADTVGFRNAVTVTTAAGESHETTLRSGGAEAGEFRLILLDDGQAKGRGKTKTKGGHQGDWNNPDIDP